NHAEPLDQRGGVVQVWDTINGQLQLPPIRCKRSITLVALSPDGKRLLTVAGTQGDDSNQVCTWTAANGRLEQSKDLQTRINAAIFSPDGRLILIALGDKDKRESQGEAQIWESESGRLLVRAIHNGAVNHAAFSPDGGQFITGSADRNARVWDTVTGKATT